MSELGGDDVFRVVEDVEHTAINALTLFASEMLQVQPICWQITTLSSPSLTACTVTRGLSLKSWSGRMS